MQSVLVCFLSVWGHTVFVFSFLTGLSFDLPKLLDSSMNSCCIRYGKSYLTASEQDG